MIFSVFCWRLIRMVGPSTTAAAAAPVVVTNCRRSIPFRLVMDLPSIHFIRKATRGEADDAPPRARKALQSVYSTLRAYWSAVPKPDQRIGVVIQPTE